jgi:flagellin-like protein
MNNFLKSKNGISPIIGTLLLVVIVVAASIAAFAWIQSSTENQIDIAGGFLILDNVRFYDSDKIEVVLRNSGSSGMKIDVIYIGGIGHQVDQILNSKSIATFDLDYSWSLGTKVKIKAVSSSGLSAERIYDSPSESFTTQIDWVGDGTDGPLLVTSGATVINNYCYLTGNENLGENTISVNDVTGFSVDDEIFIIQVQNSSNGIAGKYEYKQISQINGNDITLASSLDNNYYSGIFDQVGATATQIVRVPQYTSVTINSGSSITSPAWDGYSGGIVIFRAETVTINSGAVIDVSEKGFRGGAYGPSYNKDGFQGESYLGKGIGGASYGLGKLNNAGGGGAFICGGGGEYGGGATNSDPWIGSGDTFARKGVVYGQVNLNELFFGSGGGGQWNGGDPDPSDGGDGGGIIMIYADSITAVTDSILANGETTTGIQYGSYSYGSSGGAGGSIYLFATTIDGETNFCNTVGGLGNHSPTRDGGDGGVGRIRLDYENLNGTTNPAPGYTGSIP